MLSIALTTLALASSPGMAEGPPGCTWNAIVTLNRPAQKLVTVKLVSVHGTCMQHGDCADAHAGLLLEVPAGPQKYVNGQPIRVWIDTLANGKTRASLDLPTCTRVPIKN